MEKIHEDVCSLMTRKMPFLSLLSDEEFADLSHHFSCRQAKKNTLLWQTGDPGDFLVFISSGRVQLKVNTEMRGTGVVVGIYGPGSIIGELGVLAGGERVDSASVVEDAELVILEKESYFQMIEEHPALGVKLMSGMLLAVSTRLHKAFERLASLF